MAEHNPTPRMVGEHPEQIGGYDSGTEAAARSP
jgi:hypothetical protein